MQPGVRGGRDSPPRRHAGGRAPAPVALSTRTLMLRAAAALLVVVVVGVCW